MLVPMVKRTDKYAGASALRLKKEKFSCHFYVFKHVSLLLGLSAPCNNIQTFSTPPPMAFS
jgi:hypothetical protein